MRQRSKQQDVSKSGGQTHLLLAIVKQIAVMALEMVLALGHLMAGGVTDGTLLLQNGDVNGQRAMWLDASLIWMPRLLALL